MVKIDKRFILEKFPFQQVLCLEPMLDYWKEKAEFGNMLEMGFAKKIIGEAAKVPELFNASPDPTIIGKNYSLIKNMLSFVISPFLQKHGM